jgi:hypothetical protein
MLRFPTGIGKCIKFKYGNDFPIPEEISGKFDKFFNKKNNNNSVFFWEMYLFAIYNLFPATRKIALKLHCVH